MDNYELPSGWIECKLDDAYCLNFGQSPSTTTYNDKGIGLPFFQGKAEFQEIYPRIAKYCSVPKKTAKKNSTLLSLRAPVGPTNLAPEKCAIGRGLASIRPMCNVNYMFTLYLLRVNEQKLKVGQKGTTFDAITSNQVKNLIIKFPPLNEQKKIVEKLEKLFSNLDNSDKYLAHLEKQLKRYRQSVLKSAFEGQLTREWRENQTDLESAEKLLEKIKDERIKYIDQEIRRKFEDKTEKWILDKVKKEVDKFHLIIQKASILNDGLWISIPLEGITTLLGDGLHGTPKYVENSEYYFVNGNNLQEGKLVIKNDTKSVSQEEYSKYKKTMNNNTILVSINGTLGNVAFYNSEKVVLGKSACYFNLIDLINKHYMFWRINSHGFRTYADKSATGSTIKNLPLSAMRKYQIPICSSAEQNEIVKQIEKHTSIIDKLETVVQKSIKESERLRQSILKQAFEGKLVEQDSNDESAEKLLEKIAKVKEKYIKKTSKRKKK